MTKAKFILINSIVWILLAAAIISIAIEAVWMLVEGSFEYIPVRRLVFNFIIGLVVGASVILTNLLSMVFKSKPLFGYVLSMLCVAAILAGVYVHTGITIGDWRLDTKWLIILSVSEILTLLAIYFWKRDISRYNTKLELKKSSLK